MLAKVVITGCTGFIGGALTSRLLSQGVVVYGVDVSAERLERFSAFENFHPVVMDFTHYDDLAKSISDSGIDVFYHFAWQGVFGQAFNDYELQLGNAIAACRALDQAAQLGVRKFVFAGTKNEIEVQWLLHQNDDIKPRNTVIYATAKQSAEMICKTMAYGRGIEYSAGLIAMAYGEHNHSRMLVNVVIESFLKGQRPKLAAGLQPYDLIYISDIVDAFIAIGEKGHNLKSYYVGHRKLQSFKACIEQMRDVICPGLDLAFGEYPDTTDINYGMVNLNALHDDTGFSCKADFSESILRTAAWLASTLHEEDLRPELMSQGLRAKLEESLGGGQPSSIRHLTPVALKWMVA